ncbi:MAG: hypothetical protein JO267_05570 [Alphaproteobacteria bacterium]|nr:hypothetical protein [Alphaproteobacteria bacterium]
MTRGPVSALSAAAFALALSGCAPLPAPSGATGATEAAPGPITRTEQGGRYIEVIGQKQQHAPPFLGIDNTNYYVLRSWIDRSNGQTLHQLYVETSYFGAEKHWQAARDGWGQQLRFVPVSHDEITCENGTCSYAEEFAAAIPEPELRGSTQGLVVAFTDRVGEQMTIQVPPALIAMQLAAFDAARDRLAAVGAPTALVNPSAGTAVGANSGRPAAGSWGPGSPAANNPAPSGDAPLGPTRGSATPLTPGGSGPITGAPVGAVAANPVPANPVPDGPAAAAAAPAGAAIPSPPGIGAVVPAPPPGEAIIPGFPIPGVPTPQTSETRSTIVARAGGGASEEATLTPPANSGAGNWVEVPRREHRRQVHRRVKAPGEARVHATVGPLPEPSPIQPLAQPGPALPSTNAPPPR